MKSNLFVLSLAAGIYLLVSCVQAAPVTNGLVVYYNGSLSGSSLVDLSGNNNMGYATNVASGINQSTGAHYINLNGVNSSIDVSNNVQTDISSPVSIEFLGSVNEFKKYGALVSKYDEDTVTGWYLGCSAHSPYQQVRFAMCAWNAISGTNSLYGDKSVDCLVAGQVYDIVATYDNSTARIYINGKSSGKHIWNSTITGNSKNITIGSGSGIPNGNCSMCAFRLYNRALSPAEVEQNFEYDRPTFMIHPAITWSNPADITCGTALSSIQLDASASVLGTFVYTPASGTVLSEGTHTLHVDFTPSDTTYYTTASGNVSINVVNNDTSKSSSDTQEYGPVKQEVLEPINTQPLNSSEDIGNDMEYKSGNKTGLESGNKTTGNNTLNKGLQVEQKETQSIPNFEIYCGVVYLLGVFLYKRK
jgi:hypothetical protein